MVVVFGWGVLRPRRRERYSGRGRRRRRKNRTDKTRRPRPQAEEVRQLQERIAQLEEQLRCERRQSELQQQQLEQVLASSRISAAARAAAAAAAAGGGGIGGGGGGGHGQPSSSAPPSASSAAAGRGGTDGAAPPQQEEMVTIGKAEYELLLLKDKAIDVLSEGLTIADFTQPDMPLIYINAGFSRITGYSRADTVGRNCRFLQAEGTDTATVQQLRECIQAGRACAVQLMNVKKNGDPFVNYLSVAPLFDKSGRLTHYVGIQSDITELVNHRKAELAAKHAALQVIINQLMTNNNSDEQQQLNTNNDGEINTSAIINRVEKG